MSYNVQDKLTFVVEIQKRGDTSFLTKLASDINAGLANATKGTRTFATETTSSMNAAKTAVQGAVTVYNAFGKSVSSSYTPLTQFNAAIGKNISTINSGVAANQKYGASYAVLGNNAKSSISFITQLDTTIRRNATTMNTGSTAATAYSAIFKTIPLSVQSATAALNANSAATSNNAARMQQASAATSTAIANTVRYNSVLQQQSAATTQLASTTNNLSTAQTRQNQAIISNARGASTLVLSFAMLNTAATDYRINQESMADITQKVTDAKDRLTAAIAKYGEESHQAQQAASALQKAERGLRFELREQQNQLNNMLFLYILIGQEIVSSAIPAFLNLGKTIATVRGGFSTFTSALAGIPSIFAAFGRGADRSADAISNIGKSVAPTNRGISILSSGFVTGGGAATKFEKALHGAETAGNKFRGGLTRLTGLIGGAGGGALGAGLIAAGVGLALYSANTNGARDAVNGFGVVVGKLNPVLKGIGDGLVGVAGSLGLTGETAVQTQGHFDDMNKAFDDAGKGYADFVDTLLSNSNIAVQAIGAVAQAAGALANPQDIIPETGGGKEDMTGTNDWLRGKTGTGANDKTEPSDLIDGFSFPGQNPKQLITGEEITNMNKFTAAQDKLNALRKEFYTVNQQSTPEYIEAEKQNVYWNTKVVQAFSDLIVTGEQYDQVLMTLGKRNAVMNLGYETANVEMKENALSLIGLTGKLNGYEDALETASYQNNLVTEGVQKQREAFIGEQQEVFRLQGTFAMLGEQIQNQGALEVAYRTGVLETNIALLQREKAISKQTGSLDAYHNAIASGQVQQLAYNEGINKQREALYQSVEAASSAQGQFMELTKQLNDGTRQAAAFNQGYAETTLAIQMGNVEIAAAQGSWNAWVDAAQSGAVAAQAFQKGVLAQNDALKASYETLHQSAGALSQFQAQLKTGIPQGIAFAQTLTDLGTAAAGMEVELAKSMATLMFNQSKFTLSLNDTRNAMVDLNGVTTPTIASLMKFGTASAKAFTDGRVAAYEWINGMVESAHATAGLTLETANLAGQIPVLGDNIRAGMVPALKEGVAATQEFIALFLKAPEAIGKVRDELKSIFDGVIDGFADAMRKGEDEMDDAIDEFSEHLGIEFNKGVTEALEFHAGSDLFADLTKDFGALFIGIGDNLDQESFDHLKDQVQGRLESTMDKVMDDLPEGPLKESVKTSMQNIMNLFENVEAGDMGSPTAITNLIGGIGMELMNLDASTNNFQTTWDALMAAMMRGDLAEVNRLMKTLNTDMNALNAITFDPVTAQFSQIQTSVKLTSEEIQKQIEIVKQLGEAFNGLDFTPANTKSYFDQLPTEGGVLNNKDGKIQQGSTPVQMDETPIDMTKLKPSSTPWGSGAGSGVEQKGIAAITTQAQAATAALAQLKTTAETTMTAITTASVTASTAVVTNMGLIVTGSMEQFTLLVEGAIGSFENIGLASGIIVEQSMPNFGLMVTGAMQQFTLLVNGAIGSFTNVGNASGIVPQLSAPNFGLVVTDAMAQFTTLVTGAIGSFTNVGNASAITVQIAGTNFLGLVNVATQHLTTIVTNSVTKFTAAGNAARHVTIGVTKHYNDSKSNAQGVLSTMESNAETSFQAMGDSAVAVAEGVDKHFGKAADDGIALIKALERSVVASMAAMATAAGRVASAIDKIGSSATSAKGKVDSLASAINGLKDKTVTITYRQVTTGTRPSGAYQGTTGITNFAQGGIHDNQTITTGESGDELVEIYDQSGRLRKKEKVNDIKSYGLARGETIRVQPLEGQYAKNFQAKYGNIINMASGQNWYYQNQNGVIRTNMPGMGNNTGGNPTNNNGNGGGSSSPYSDVTPFVPVNGSTIGRPYSDGSDTVFSADPYNRNLTSGEWGRSYLGGGRWYDPVTGKYYTGSTPVNGGGGSPGTGTPGSGGGGNNSPPQVVTTQDGRVKITQGNGQQSIIIDGREMLPQSSLQSFENSANTFSNAVETNNSSTDSRGNNFNNQNDVNTNSNGQGNNAGAGSDPLNSSPSTTSNSQFNYQNNGKFYKVNNGTVQTNMTAEEIAAADADYFARTGKHFPTGTPQGGGTQGPGSGQQTGKIWNLKLGAANMGEEKMPFEYQNDPMGWHNYGLISDPIFKERLDKQDVFGNNPTNPNDPNHPNNPRFDWAWIAELLKQILGTLRLGRNTQVTIGGNQIMEIVQDRIMDGFTNFK